MTFKRHTTSIPALAALALLLSACGGGGGGSGGSSGGGNPPPPPPPSSVTYTVSLTDVTLTDRQTSSAVSETGLPVSGAVATRSP
jgi:hypothetical protein